MKSIKMLLVAVCAILTVSLFAQEIKTVVIKVNGECGMCKKKIETAAKQPGVTKADWNKDTKQLTLSYNPAKVNTDSVQKKIAAVGYDTEKYKADDKAYGELDECCQYERKKQ
ncbi:Heavy-metal-associated domain-containing protein [Filimonas lacunae]|uniref:Heavy-metal-associated domain-containing protein n=1 Tax=Filimonas lacunae TaxID=477680 RepID=A0A173MQK8_9BACT|nr:cation transporter [Filimonas lacunae]BAV09776.1 Co/Zn/Cd efflux system membrane fusion protein [Filimonas lacunae]SIS78807.1 Heavy-metal-associated domain-containing protein [Filimonas lacunae]